ncbi:trypsin-like peptidase domain-containing protein [Micromonospora sp. WMMD1102]|uniref:S1C family serine protease n=1 Tax=Micromonospora sp. WMMD1102 TaxID=3016105 RepID=UPI00241516A2|nr:trypsin-like peptidase domain-containing protein [Micromonospora sp. WMMD1102]MDG4784726.1 trypsin-like peptidase domain-containing protein [Micromonospora sp. WMMD1102]
MNDFETDPQRRPVTADSEHSHHTAELPRDDRGQSDSGASSADAATPAASPTGSTDPTAEQPYSGVPASGQPYAGASAPGQPYGGGPASGQPYAGPPAPGQPYGGAPASGAHYGGAPASGTTYGGNPYAAAPASGQPYSLPPTGRPGGVPGQPGGSPWQAPSDGRTQSPWAPGHTGGPPQQPSHLGGPVPPPWATPGTPAPSPSGSGRVGRAVAVGVAALALMLGSGIAGGAIVTALDDDSPTETNRTYSAAPVINAADLPKIAAQVQPSVVSISTSSSEGSGVVTSANGFVLTNNHVVASAEDGTVKVFFADGRNAEAKVVGTDPKTDLAVVKVDGVSGLTAAKLGDSDAMQIGDQVLALGSPLGLQGSVTAGIISARDRTIRAGGGGEQQSPFEQPQQGGASSIAGLLQTDAPINPGNSGGALVNTRAEVIGINTAILTAGQGNGNIGVGFAIPSNKARAVAEALQRGEKVSHPSLGVQVTPAENGGALVGGVVPDSPAAKAGLQQGDVVTQFGDKLIGDADDLVGAVQAGKVGDQVQVTYTRNGVEKTATVTLAETS